MIHDDDLKMLKEGHDPEAEALLEPVVKDKALINKHRGNFIRQYEAARNSGVAKCSSRLSTSASACSNGHGITVSC